MAAALLVSSASAQDGLEPRRILAPEAEPPEPAEPPVAPSKVVTPQLAAPAGMVGGTWSNLGPASTINAQVTVPPSNKVSGAIQALVAHPTNPNILYIGAVNGGIWKTTNATAADPTWIPLSDALPSQAIGALEFDPTDATRQTLVAGSGRVSSFAARGGIFMGVPYSTNGGATWTLLGTNTFANESLTSVAARGNILMACSDNASSGSGSGLFRSTNTGASFALVSGGSGLSAGPVSDLVADPGNINRFYAAVRTVGVFRSDDAGATWVNVTAGITGISATTSKIEMAAHSSGGTNVVYVGVLNSAVLASVWRSTDLGASWTQMDTPNLGGQGSIHFSIVADPTNSSLVYLGGQTAYFRGDASLGLGTQFTSIQGANANNTTPHADSREMVFDANGNIIEGSDGGVYRRETPQSSSGRWVSVNGNLGVIEAHDVAWDSVTHTAMIGTQDNGTHISQINAGLTWLWISGGDGGDVAIDDRSLPGKSIRYSSSQNLGSFRRRTYDASNVQLSNVTPALTLLGGSPAISGQFVTPVEINKIDPARIAIGGGNSVYESLDRGNSVTALATNFIVNRVALAYGGYLAGAPNPDVIYYGSSATVRLRTTLGGTVAATAAAYPGTTVRDVVMNTNDWRQVFALDISGVYASSNAGTNWANITGNLTGVGELRALEFFRLGGTDCVAAGTDMGVFVSFTNNLGVWTQLGTGLPKTSAFDLVYNPQDNLLLVGTLGRGVYKLDLAGSNPILTGSGSALLSESCSPTNGVIDPGETVTVSLTLTNSGDAATSSLVATLAAGSGVLAPSGPQNYGTVAPNGGVVSRSFSFRADGPCGGSITASLQLQDGSNNLGVATFVFPLGIPAVTNTTMVSNTASISIPSSGNATPYPSAIAVSNVAGAITKVTVTLSNLTHQFAADIDALLVSPGGQKVMIMSDAGGNFYPATTLTVAASDTGHYDSTGLHQPATQNYIAGDNGGGASSLHRNFFAFNIPALPGPLVGAQLRVYAANVVTGDASETYSVFPVTNSVAALTAGGSGLTNIYNDLGDGTSYGARVFTTNDSGQFVTISLGTSAVTAISNAAGSSFAVGGAVTTLDTSTNNTVETVFSGSTGGGADVQLVLFIGTPVTLTFDDAAANILPITNLTSGTYLPTDYSPGETMTAPAPVGPYATNLSVFNGGNPNGTWQLYVLDDLGGGTGVISNGWSLKITTQTTNSCCLDPTAADVGVSVTAAPDPVLVGSNLTYTVSVSNTGPATATGVIVTNDLPAGVMFISASTSQGTINTNLAGDVIASVGTLASGASASLSIIVKPTSAGALPTLVNVVANQFDFNSLNNSVTASPAAFFPIITIDDVSVTEGNAGTVNAIFTATLSVPYGVAVTAEFFTIDVTALAGLDYLATNGVVTFPPGVTNQTIIVRVLGDTLFEDDETFTLKMNNAINGQFVIEPGHEEGERVGLETTSAGTILNDDLPPVVSIANTSVTERNVTTTNAVFTVSLSAASSLPVTVTAFTADGTANAGTDYVAKSNTVTINAGALSNTFSVVVLGDTTIEPNESFLVTLDSPINATIGVSPATGTIVNDDGLPGNLDHFQWSTIGNPQLLNIPFLTTLTARDASNNLATNFNGPAALSGWVVMKGSDSIEDFDTNIWPHTPWLPGIGTNVTGTLSNAFAHDGTNGLRDPEWMYRTDVKIGYPGDRISVWVRPGSSNAGRAYLGFGASSNGCWSFVAAPNAGDLRIQQNVAYGFTEKATNTQVWQSNKWYRMSVEFVSTNSVVCNLYDSDGVTPLNSMSMNGITGLPGGVALRSFSSFSIDTLNNDAGFLQANFEPGLQGFTVNNAFGAGAGLWHLSSGRADNAGHTASNSLYYGTNETATGGGNYDTGNNEGVITSSTIDLSAATAPLQLSFSYLLQTEGGTTFDQALVEISTNGGASFNFVAGTSNSTLAQSVGVWTRTNINLSAYAGSQAQLRFHFRTGDGQVNNFEGWYVDDIAITKPDVAVPITPTNAPTFTNGVWSGPLTVLQLVTNMIVRAGDNDGHTNDSNPFNVAPLVNDISLTFSDAPDPVMIGSNLTYTLIASNSGPSTATSVTVTNPLPFVVNFVSASTGVGSFVFTNNRVIFSLGSLAAGATVTMNVVVVPQVAGTITSTANIARGEADQTLVNNTASVSTTVVLPTLSISDAAVIEGNANAMFTVTLKPSITFTSRVSFATADGSALAGSDYVATSGLLTFLPGETSKLINVPVLDDSTPEINETFKVTLSSPILATIADGTGVGTILNDDALPPLGNPTRNDFAMPNGTVNAILETNGVIYLGGSFTEMGTNTGKATPFDAVTGAALANYPNIDRVVNSIISDGAGGWYLAGDIQSANGVPQPRLLHLLTNRTIDPAFSAAPNSVVNALVLNGTNLYVGGVFTTITNGGTNYSRNRFAVLDSATGVPRSLPSNPAFNNTVSSLAFSGGTLYVGGLFTNVANGVTNTPRSHLAALNAATGVPTPFQADVDLFTGANTVSALALNSGTLYLGGSFTNVGGSPRFRIAAVDATTGALSAWNPNMNSTVSALATDGTNLYAGGIFTVVTNGGTTVRSNLAALSLASGAPTTWAPNPNGSVQAMEIDGANLYVGGNFTAIGGTTDRRRLACVSLATGLANGFDPDVGGQVSALAVDGGVVYAGGLMSFYKGAIRNRLAAIDATSGELTPWDPNANNTVNALTAAGNTIYAGGIFTNVGGFTATRIVALDDVVGDPVPGFNAAINSTVNALAVSGSNLYVGGIFTAVSNNAVNFVRTNLAALNVTSGALNPAFTAQVLSANPLVSSVLAITPAGTNLYVGGNFTNVGGQLRQHVAALNPDTGVPHAWNPGTDTNVQAILVRSTNVYVGGTFTNMTNSTGASVPRNRLAAISSVTGDVTVWNPNANSTVTALEGSATNVYAGGNFGIIGGRTNADLIELNAAAVTNMATPFTPGMNAAVNALLLSGTRLYVGGSFNAVGLQSRVGFAVFESGLAPMVTLANTNLTFTEGDPATLLDPALTVATFTDLMPTGAVVSITGNFASGQDVLTFTPPGGITGSYNAGTGVLTLSGAAPAASYQAALRTVTYQNASENPSGAQRSVQFVVRDSSGPSSPGSFTINVVPVNDPPTLSPIGAQSIVQNQLSFPIPFIVGDAESATSNLFPSAFAANPVLLPSAGFFFSGTASNRTLRILPGSNQFGSTTVTLFLSDGTNVVNTMFPVTVLVDTDGDGVPDVYEMANGMNKNDPTDAGKDFDGDGMSNLQEYLAGTNPNDPNNYLRVVFVATVGADAQITFTSITGKTYRVEKSDDVVAGVWTLVADNVPGTGGNVTAADAAGASQPQRVYRVRLLP